MRPPDIIGKKFGKLVVIGRSENTKQGKAKWICKCECGNIKKKPVTTSDLISGKVISCGCYYKTSNKGRNKTHGDTGKRLWNIWMSMKNRCYCESNQEYKNYGGRGITVCEEWKSNYESFKTWAMSHGYSDNLTIDRIDTDKGYFPDNCRWATYQMQENNRRNNLKITIGNQTHTIRDLSNISGIKPATIIWRYKNGWNESDLLIKPDYNNKSRRKSNE